MKISDLKPGDLLIATAPRDMTHLLILENSPASQYGEDFDVMWWDLTKNKKDRNREVGDKDIKYFWKVIRDGEEVLDTED